MPPKRKRNQDESDEEEPTTKTTTKSTSTTKGVGKSKSSWETEDETLVYNTFENLPNTKKVAAFDMDHTLLEPKSTDKKGKAATFPANRSDWRWLLPEVPTKLKELHADGFRIVIFTNQGGIEKGKQKQSDITGKIDDLATELGIPIQALIAIATDGHRKPHPTMWKFFIKKLNGGVEPDMTESFYCGDAAGRQKEWAPGRGKDFSSGDRAFAHNCGLKFYTPEEYFLKEKPAPFVWDSTVDPVEVLKKAPASLSAALKDKLKPIEKRQELVLLVGPPASGKSTLSKKYFVPHDYVHVNMDTLKTKPKCKQTALKGLDDGKSVVVDNTNPTIDARSEYVKMARERDIPVRCFVMKTDIDLAHHLNFFREKVQGVRRIPDVGYNVYKSKFQPPTKKEGFEDIIEVDWVPHFDDDTLKKAFLERTE